MSGPARRVGGNCHRCVAIASADRADATDHGAGGLICPVSDPGTPMTTSQIYPKIEIVPEYRIGRVIGCIDKIGLAAPEGERRIVTLPSGGAARDDIRDGNAAAFLLG